MLAEGFSGSDLHNLLKVAAQRPLKEFLKDERAFLAGRMTQKPRFRALSTRDLVDSIDEITTQQQNRSLGTFV